MFFCLKYPLEPEKNHPCVSSGCRPAIFGELRESSTIWVSRPELLLELCLKKSSLTFDISSYLGFAYFQAIVRLGRRPQITTYLLAYTLLEDKEL